MATNASRTDTDSPHSETDSSHSTNGPTTDPDRSNAEPDDPYTIRPFEPCDREGYLELSERVSREADDERFRWKYEDTPYADHVPIVLATTTEGEIVGAKPSFPLELRAGDRTVIGFQPADGCVHPDHRGRGLAARMAERTTSRYAGLEPSLLFAFSDRATLTGPLERGWQVVEDVPTYYRVHRPDALVDLDSDGVPASLSAASRRLATGYLRARDATVARPPDVSVNRFADIPVDQFAELYRRAIPETFHAHRDETFYGWRFENPAWTYDAYLASRAGEPIAGVVVGTRTTGGSKIASVTDVVPLCDTRGRSDGLAAILDRATADHADADLFAASGRAVPADLLTRFGFHSDQTFPLSKLTTSVTQVAYPAASSGHEWTVADRAVADPSNWTVTFAERQTR